MSDATPATDAEVAEIAALTRSGTVMHWPGILRMAARIAADAAEIKRLRSELSDCVAVLGAYGAAHAPEAAFRAYSEAKTALGGRDE